MKLPSGAAAPSPAPASPAGRGPAFRIPGLRWWIVGLLFLASAKNYLDRQTLSILAPTIQKDLHISEVSYGNIVNLFLVAYGLAYLVSGRLTDWLGTRLSMVVFMSWWSVAGMLTAVARSAASLGGVRFLLGLGEAGNYTVAPKVVAEWFQPKERGLAIGIYTLGATIGATAAPLLIVGLNERWGWQVTFAVIGATGFIWLVPWLWLYYRPQEHPRITAAERALVPPASPAPPVGAARETEWSRWKAVLTRRDVWLLLGARMVTDPVWYFYQFWLAKYLYSVRHVDQKELSITWVVYLAADIGTLGGGLLSGLLVKRGTTPMSSRLWAMLACACVVPLSALVPVAPSVGLALACSMAVVLAHMAWLINVSALVVDAIPQRIIGTAFGVVAAGSTFGGVLMNEVVKRLATSGHYETWFIVMACLHPLVWLALWGARVHRPAAAVTSDAIS
ncbi:MAG TPA: MFS transporter [Bacillota bacterium]|nr:MFS transporter [Bacillota bacterium]